MLIVVTDEGRVWNHNSPVLEQYADCVLVVCLNGKAVTDELVDAAQAFDEEKNASKLIGLYCLSPFDFILHANCWSSTRVR